MASTGLGSVLRAASDAETGRPAKDTSVILLWLDGGPGHMDLCTTSSLKHPRITAESDDRSRPTFPASRSVNCFRCRRKPMIAYKRSLNPLSAREFCRWSNCNCNCNCSRSGSGQQIVHDFSMHIREPEIAAFEPIRQCFVVDPQQMHH
jgi:hypothetical protein